MKEEDPLSDPILDEIERKMAMGEIRGAMKDREFWEMTEHAIVYARFVYDKSRKINFSRRQSMSIALNFAKRLFFHRDESS